MGELTLCDVEAGSAGGCLPSCVNSTLFPSGSWTRKLRLPSALTVTAGGTERPLAPRYRRNASASLVEKRRDPNDSPALATAATATRRIASDWHKSACLSSLHWREPDTTPATPHRIVGISLGHLRTA